MRAVAEDLPEPDVLDLLAAAPEEPADRAAYLTLIGQHAQRRALDPDGSLLAPAYRAAAGELRERLRTILAAEGAGEVIRVVVTGDQRDRIAELSHDELDYLGHHLAEHHRWDGLRRLARDLPLAEAAAAARLLPADQRTSETAALLTAPDTWSPERLRAVGARLPGQKVISLRKGHARVSFSPDQAELAVNTTQVPPDAVIPTMLVETIDIGTGESTVRLREQRRGQTPNRAQSILHLGDEIIRSRLLHGADPAITRVHPRRERIPLEGPAIISDLRRASTGAVAITSSGLVFIDRDSSRQRHIAVPRIAEKAEPRISRNPRFSKFYSCRITTLPEAQLIAAVFRDHILVMDEHGTLLHDVRGKVSLATFLTPDSLAVIPPHTHGRCHIWILSSFDSAELQSVPGAGWVAFQGWAVFAGLRRFPLDPDFAEEATSRLTEPELLDRLPELLVAPGGPGWLKDEDPNRRFVAVSPYGDTIVISMHEPPLPQPRYDVWTWGRLEVHSPYLSSAREALERPLLHATPQDRHRVRELRSRIGDPGVREALGLLDACLEVRFGGDIALGTGPVSAGGGPHDITLGADRAE